MGCGKSSVGRRLSQLLCCPFMDLDEMIEKAAGKTIPKIFSDEGETGFRSQEKTVLTSLLSGKAEKSKDRATHGTKAGGSDSSPIGVISLGGGTVMTRECAEIVHSDTLCIYLRASVETLIGHLDGETANRPMLSGNLKDRITELMAQRSSTYESTAHIIIDIDGQTVEETAETIISLLPRH